VTRRGEFDLIDGVFAPLARGASGALGLADDAAVFEPPTGIEIVATTDALVASVHFNHDDPPDLVGRKLLRVSLSDLASMGAEPDAYLLTVALPPDCDESWLETFASGLSEDQEEFKVHLIGGDTVATRGPLLLSVTALGRVPTGQALLRSGASEGDEIWVSGSIGDGALGLLTLQSGVEPQVERDEAWLKERYLLPRPRTALGLALRGLASSCIDVSDGLIADLNHVCEASGVSAVVNLECIPISEPAKALLSDDPKLIRSILGGGDDYELLFTAPSAAHDAVRQIADTCEESVTRIGEMSAGSGVIVVNGENEKIDIVEKGYTHF
tara:strand:- start:285 stop:1265 length:981 start_codon:yes stop_codon:yes gene_type:complete